MFSIDQVLTLRGGTNTVTIVEITTRECEEGKHFDTVYKVSDSDQWYTKKALVQKYTWEAEA